MRKLSVLLWSIVLLSGICKGGFAMDTPVVVLETNQGVIEVKLMPDVAPKACENFIGLVEKGYYNGVIFHRVIKGQKQK